MARKIAAATGPQRRRTRRVAAHSRRSRRGLAVRELLLIVAALMIAFGLMVSLARRVRSEAAFSLVQRELLELEDALAAYRREYGRLPDVPPLIDGTPGAVAGADVRDVPLRPEDEITLRDRALVQNRALVHALGVGARPAGSKEAEGQPGGAFASASASASGSALGGVSAMMFDGSALLDPWGRPLAYLPAGRPQIGTAAGNAPFFFSAGPDGQYLTRDDNVYSYEVLTAVETTEAGRGAP